MDIESKTLKTTEVKFNQVLETRNVITKNFAQEYLKMHLRVAAYARVSTDSDEQQTSYISQKTHYEGLIKQNPNWEFVGIYADEGITGTQTKKRDNFNDMIQDALNGLIDMILVKSISRFARNTVDTLNCVRLLREHNVDVYFERENIHTISITNELFLTLYSAFAQGESESISENMKGGLRMKMKRGGYLGQAKCYGYTWNKEKEIIEINESEMEIVKRIFQEYARGNGTTLIAKNLNNDGILSPKNKKWKGQTISRILRNEKYIGDLRSGKYFIESVITHKQKLNEGQQVQYYTEDRHEAGISRELFNNANTMLKMRSDKSKQHRDKYSRRYPFSSITYCGCCGERFIRKSYLKNKKDPNSERVIIWGCRSHQNDIECNNKINYKDEELKAMFVVLYNQLYSNKEIYAKSFLKQVNSVINDINVDKEKNKLLKDKENIILKQSKLLDLSLDGNISKSLLDSKMLELNNKLNAITEKLEKISNNEKLKNQKTEQLSKIMDIIESKRQLSEFDEDVFNAIVDRIVIGDIKEDGTFDYKTIKFILKTGETLISGTGMNILNFTLEKANEKLSTFNFSLEKIEEDKSSGLTAYIQHQRSIIGRRKRRNK